MLGTTACFPNDRSEPKGTVTVEVTETAGGTTGPEASPTDEATEASSAPSVETSSMPPADDRSFESDGYGEVKVGMSREALRAKGFGSQQAGCSGLVPGPNLPKGLTITVIGDQLAVLSTKDPNYRTHIGAQVGSTLEKLKTLYGKFLVEYPSPTGPYWYVAEKGNALIFQFEAGESVVAMHAVVGNGKDFQVQDPCKAQQSTPKPTDSGNPFANAKFTTEGYGPMTIGMPEADLLAKGWAKEHKSEHCTKIAEGDLLEKQGILLGVNGKLRMISTEDQRHRTPAGAHVGMTLAELRKMYPKVLRERRGDFGTFWVIVGDKGSVVFTASGGRVATMHVVEGNPQDFIGPEGC